MALTRQHTHQVLTKRADRMREYFNHYNAGRDHNRADYIADAIARRLGRPGARGAERTEGMDFQWPLPNVWLGVSVEDQKTADERIPHLLETPAAVRFLSIEPLLGPVDLSHYLYTRVDWVICGGESGAGARPMHPDWVRSIRNQCQMADVPFFFKQWGNWMPSEQYTGDFFRTNIRNRQRIGHDGTLHGVHGMPVPDDLAVMVNVGKKKAGRLLDGREWNEMPEAA